MCTKVNQNSFEGHEFCNVLVNITKNIIKY
jgi:hypothetical protein